MQKVKLIFPHESNTFSKVTDAVMYVEKVLLFNPSIPTVGRNNLLVGKKEYLHFLKSIVPFQ